MDKKEFVIKLGELLRIAKPNLVSCKLATGAQIIADCDNEYYFRQLHKEVLPDVYSDYVVITCENGYQYFVNVTANSLAAIASAVFEYAMYK